jgi:uncharacterized FlaG/YvyC family protein
MKKDYVSVDGHADLVRDPKSNAVLNINKSEIQNAREAKKIRQQKLREEQELKETVDTLKEEMNDIKSLLSQLVEKL